MSNLPAEHAMTDWVHPYMRVDPALKQAEQLLRHADKEKGIAALLEAVIALCVTITVLRQPMTAPQEWIDVTRLPDQVQRTLAAESAGAA